MDFGKLQVTQVGATIVGLIRQLGVIVHVGLTEETIHHQLLHLDDEHHL